MPSIPAHNIPTINHIQISNTIHAKISDTSYRYISNSNRTNKLYTNHKDLYQIGLKIDMKKKEKCKENVKI